MEAAVELEDAMSDVDEKRNRILQLDELVKEEVALIPCGILWNGLPLRAGHDFII